MQTVTKPWLPVLIVAAFALCAGFVAGALLGLRERGAAKDRNEALSRESASLRSQLTEAEARGDELAAQLDRTENEVEFYKNQSLVKEYVSAEIQSDNGDFHPPVEYDADSSDAERRLAELECEVVALRELIQRNAALPVGPPSPTTGFIGQPASTGTTLAKASDPAPVRQQCNALTKKGVRCSRPARSNGKCWQHGG